MSLQLKSHCDSIRRHNHLLPILGPLGLGILLFVFSVPIVHADEQVPPDPPLRWWKGNIHTHTLWSDGNDFPEMVAEWYRTHDYNFLALSDHNILSEGMRWMPLAEIERRGGDQVLPKYLGRFGASWVEVRRTETENKGEGASASESEGEAETREVRLKPLNEFRSLVEERGRFIMMVGEEISDSVQGKPVHMNATNLRDLLQPLGGRTVAEAIRANFRAAEDQARRQGREILVHLNHPNFHYAITAEDLAEAIEERFFEVYNGHPGVNHLGDEDHPTVEQLWDLANTLRLTRFNAAPLMGVATDDSHSYHDGKGSTPGRGWIMVQAHHLTAESIIKAIKRGNFYASSGVTIDKIHFDEESKTLKITVEAEPGVDYTTQIVGTRKPSSGEPIDANAVGLVLDEQQGPDVRYTLKGDELYIRAVITASKPHPNPSFTGQKIQAWTQPVGWELSVAGDESQQ